MSWLRWAGVALLVGLEAGIGFLMLTPRVSADYADYYITRRTDCWPRPVTGHYALGRRLSFRDDAPGRAAMRHKQCGWIAPFAEGSWTQGDQARLRFSFVPPAEGVTLAMDARAFIAASHPQQRVLVQVNGKPLDDLLFTPQTQGLTVIAVPADIVALDPNGLTLRLDFPDRISPRDLGMSADSRELGILVSDVVISAVPVAQ